MALDERIVRLIRHVNGAHLSEEVLALGNIQLATLVGIEHVEELLALFDHCLLTHINLELK